MTSEQKKQLILAGFDYDKTLDRFSGNEALYEKYLLKFATTDETFNTVESAVLSNSSGLGDAVHALKGLTGNLGLTALYSVTLKAMNDIRNGTYTNDDFDGIKSEYLRTREALAKVFSL